MPKRFSLELYIGLGYHEHVVVCRPFSVKMTFVISESYSYCGTLAVSGMPNSKNVKYSPYNITINSCKSLLPVRTIRYHQTLDRHYLAGHLLAASSSCPSKKASNCIHNFETHSIAFYARRDRLKSGWYHQNVHRGKDFQRAAMKHEFPIKILFYRR